MKIVATKAIKAMLPRYQAMRQLYGEFEGFIMPRTEGGWALLDGDNADAVKEFNEKVQTTYDKRDKEKLAGKWTLEDEKKLMATSILTANCMCSKTLAGSPLYMKTAVNMRIFTQAELDANPFLRDIKIKDCKSGAATLSLQKLPAYELFWWDESESGLWGVDVPKVGFFEQPVMLPVLNKGNGEDDVVPVTPGEITTMECHIAEAAGDVLVLGCGMGYFPYMVSLKDDVSSVTIVDANEDVINIFNEHILPQVQNKDKVKVIHADPLDYLANLNDGEVNYCFAAMWVSCGELDTYLRVKKLGNQFKKTKMSYWMERSFAEHIATYATVTIKKAVAKAFQKDEEPPENGFSPEEKHIQAFVDRLLRKEVVDTPAKFDRILSSKYILDRLKDKKLDYTPFS